MSSFLTLNKKSGSKTHVGGGASRIRNLNQDRSLDYTLPNGISVYAVFDGHGKDGHTIAENAKMMTSNFLLENIEILQTNPKEILMSLFEKLHVSAPAFGGGTTATICVVIEDHLHVVNVGDSAAYLISPTGDLSNDLYISHEDITGKPINYVESPFFMQITDDHSPEDIFEFNLTEQKNKDLCNRKKIYHAYDTQSRNVSEELLIFTPFIITKDKDSRYLKNINNQFATIIRNDFQRLAYTRSIGDKGIDIERSPTYSCIKLIPGICLIIASDGVWDNTRVLLNNVLEEDTNGFNIVEFILSQLSGSEVDPQKIAELVIQENEKYALLNFGSFRDNATCVLCYFNYF
jgi:serine/threonine protein phosphatase PrpC